MRAVFAAFCVAGIFAAVVSATPLTRNKRYAGAFTSVGGGPYGGAAAIAGNPWGSLFNPLFPTFGFARSGVNRPLVYPEYPQYPQFPFVPFIVPTFEIPQFKNWYEGDNVCKEEKVMNSQIPDDAVPKEWEADLPTVSTDFSHEQESCKGTDRKYICVKRVMGSNGEAQIKATKYECCHGFVRDPTGAPGCVESKQKNPSGASQGTDSKLTPNDPTYYVYTGNNMQSSSSSRSSSPNIDKVPLQ